MNRYQREVAEMDRRHRLIVRSASFAAAATLAVTVLWSAGLPPTQWWVLARAWWAGADESLKQPVIARQPSLSASAYAPHTSGEPAALVQPGTESSIAAEPQPLFLVATSPGRNKGEGTALIGVDPDNPQTYVGGAMLANGARLVEIHRDHVVLARGASSAKLWLYQRSAPSAPVRDALLTVGGEESAPAPATMVRNVLTEYLRPSPLYDGEVLRGYEVYPGRKAGVFARLGLQPGDVIVAINGLRLSEPRQAMELLAELTRGSAVTATIQRKNKVQSIALDGSLIISDQDATQSSATQAAQPFGAPAG